MGIDEAIEILNYAQKVLTGNTTNPKLNFEETAKAIETLINEYSNLKQIEEAHRIENGKLKEKINLLENEIEGLKQTFVIQDDIDNHIPRID